MRAPGEVSVVIPVFNGAATIGRAIESVLTQDHAPSEVVVVNDGSTDATAEVLDSIGDPRVVTITLESNQGIAAALNVGVTASGSPLIARMDADDFATSDRFRLQVKAFSGNSGLGLVGARWNGDIPPPRPFTPAGARLVLSFGNKFSHSVVMFRRAAFEEAHGYAASAWPAEDYDLWLRISERWQVEILPDIVGHVSSQPGGISRQNAAMQQHMAATLAARSLTRLLGQTVTEEEARALQRSEFHGAEQVVSAHRLILRAASAVRRECTIQGIPTRGLTSATAYLLHQMRYRTTGGQRVLRPLALLPITHPRVATELLRERHRWIRHGGGWPD